MRKVLLKIYIVVSLLLAADITAYCLYKISLNGYYSDVMLFWLWFCGSITIIILFWKKIFAKLLLTLMTLALILSFLPMAVPFFALVFSTTPFGLRLDRDLNKNYRAQIVGYSVMAYPVLQVIEKRGILEKELFQCSDSGLLNNDLNVKIREAKDIVFISETTSTLTLALSYGTADKVLVFNKINGKIISK